jgi:hypothetical protein
MALEGKIRPSWKAIAIQADCCVNQAKTIEGADNLVPGGSTDFPQAFCRAWLPMPTRLLVGRVPPDTHDVKIAVFVGVANITCGIRSLAVPNIPMFDAHYSDNPS